MSACVVDASIMVKWYVPEVHSDNARRLLARRVAGELSIHAPDLYVAEVANVLWKKVRRGLLERQEAWDIATSVLAVPSRVYGLEALLPAALEIAFTLDAAVYDGFYLSLAASLGCPLVTADAKFRGAVASSRWAGLLRWIEDV